MRLKNKLIYMICVILALCFSGCSTPTDDFGKDIVIPKGMSVAKPKNESDMGNARDKEGNYLTTEFQKSRGTEPDDAQEVYTGRKLFGSDRELLIRHFATSSKWLLTKEDDSLCAHRRFVEYGNWRSQNEFILEIDKQWHIWIRPYTTSFLRAVDQELSAVLNSPVTKAKGYDPSLMPQESVRTGKPQLVVANSFQGGIYQVTAYANPGESGYAYLKVFEATKNTPLSADCLPNKTLEYIGWSRNMKQTFFYNVEATIYEGNWDNFYPARFELWFKPDSGKPEHKLIDNTYLICGWER